MFHFFKFHVFQLVHKMPLSPKYWQFLNKVITMPTMHFPRYWQEQKQFHPSTGISRTTPKMLLPQVLTGFRINRRHADPQCFAPSTGGIQTQSTAWGNRFPPVLAVPGPTVTVFSSSTGRTTNDPGEPRIRACRGVGLPFPGCGVVRRCEARNTVFAKGSELGRSHEEACSFWRPRGVPDCTEREVGKLGFRTKRAGTHFPTFRFDHIMRG